MLIIDRPVLRALVIVMAMLTDSVDGYLARRYGRATRFGAVLDPLMDKFFVYFALFIFSREGRITPVECLAMLSRDIALFIFGLYLLITKHWKTFAYRSVKWGKATTALQFCFLFSLALGYSIGSLFYISFVVIGVFVLIELIAIQYSESTKVVHK